MRSLLCVRLRQLQTKLRQRLNELTKSRVVDAELKKLIENDKVFTSENHFTGEDIEICKYDRSFLVKMCLHWLLQATASFPLYELKQRFVNGT